MILKATAEILQALILSRKQEKVLFYTPIKGKPKMDKPNPLPERG